MKEYSGRNTLSSIVSIIKKACMPMVKGKVGQVVGFDANGKPVAQNAPSSTGGVTSFNGRTGAVTPMTGDYTADMVGAYSKYGGILNGDVSVGQYHKIGTVNMAMQSVIQLENRDLKFYIPGEYSGVRVCQECTDQTSPILSFYGIMGDKPVQLNNIADPILNRHAANKGYVDEAIVKAINAIVYSTMHFGNGEPTADIGVDGDVYLLH